MTILVTQQKNGVANPAKAFQKMVGVDASGRPYNDHATNPYNLGVPFNSSVSLVTIISKVSTSRNPRG